MVNSLTKENFHHLIFNNRHKISSQYNWTKIIDTTETFMFTAMGESLPQHIVPVVENIHEMAGYPNVLVPER
jgi:hypothetical protein